MHINITEVNNIRYNKFELFVLYNTSVHQCTLKILLNLLNIYIKI